MTMGKENPLTPRETEILRHIAQGNPNKIIAAELVISEQTVKNYITHIIDKLQAKNRTNAVILAKERGIL